MNTLIRRTGLFFLILLSLTAGCTAQRDLPAATQAAPQPSPTQQLDYSTLVKEMAERLNAGDVEGSLAYFAEDARVYLFGLPPTGIEIYRGKDEIRTLWADSAANHFEWEIVKTQPYKDEVYIDTQTWHDFTRQLGVAPLQYTDVYKVTDGKISAYGSWITGEALARFKPALAEILPAEVPAPPSTEPPISEMTVTIENGTCTTDTGVPLKAGDLLVNLAVKDQDREMYALSLFNLDPGKDFLDLMASTASLPPAWADTLLLAELEPGKSSAYNVSIEHGPVFLICWSRPPDMPIGALGPFEVGE